MTSARSIVGAVIGAALAGAALRVRQEAQRRGVPIADMVPELPDLVAQDIRVISEAVRGAVHDGRVASRAAESELDKVLARPRQTGDTA